MLPPARSLPARAAHACLGASQISLGGQGPKGTGIATSRQRVRGAAPAPPAATTAPSPGRGCRVACGACSACGLRPPAGDCRRDGSLLARHFWKRRRRRRWCGGRGRGSARHRSGSGSLGGCLERSTPSLCPPPYPPLPRTSSLSSRRRDPNFCHSRHVTTMVVPRGAAPRHLGEQPARHRRPGYQQNPARPRGREGPLVTFARGMPGAPRTPSRPRRPRRGVERAARPPPPRNPRSEHATAGTQRPRPLAVKGRDASRRLPHRRSRRPSHPAHPSAGTVYDSDRRNETVP